MPDVTRYAKHPRSVIWTQAIGLCILVTLCGILVTTVTSATQAVSGVTTWNPLQVSLLWENRSAPFFSAACWMFAVIGTNITANSVSFSNDLRLWSPSYINFCRGAYILLHRFYRCHAVEYSVFCCFVLCLFLNGYSLFLGPFAGVILADFSFLRRMHWDLNALYRHPDMYSFFKGFNWRAFAALLTFIL